MAERISKSVLSKVLPYPHFFIILFLEQLHHLLSGELWWWLWLRFRLGWFLAEDFDCNDEEDQTTDDSADESQSRHAYLPVGRFPPEVMFHG